MERTKNTNKNRLKHGLANVFLFYTFDIFLKSLGSLIIYWRYLCQSGIREISPHLSFLHYCLQLISCATLST